MQLNARQREIVIQLSEMSSSTVYALAVQYNITKRMVYSDIQIIKNWFDHYDIKYDESTILPFVHSESLQRVQELLKQVVPYMTAFTQRTRVNLSLVNLLYCDEEITVEQLCRMLGISRSTFYRDVDLLKAWLHQFQLELDINKLKGITVLGSEKSIREAMVVFIVESMGQIDLFGLLLKKNPEDYTLDYEKNTIYENLSSYFEKEILVDAWKHIEYIISLQSYSLKEQYKIRYLWQISVSLQRNRNGYPVENINYDSSETTLEEQIVSNSFQTYQLCKDETHYLIKLLQQMLQIHRKDFPEDVFIDVLIRKLVERMSYRLHYPFQRDIRLMQNMRIHIYATIERLKLGIYEFNPIKDDIKDNYPDLFEIVKEELLHTNLYGQELSDDEISYIVIYFATALTTDMVNPNVYVVCTTGSGSALLLLSNMKNKMPYINILGSINIQEATQLEIGKADAIISTTDFYHPSIPVIIVTPLLLDGEIERINNALQIQQQTMNLNIQSKYSNHQFFEYMKLMSDCVNTIKKLEVECGKLEVDAMISVVIHLMMQCSQQRETKAVDYKKLGKRAKYIYDCLHPLYGDYDQQLGEYDIKSIELYFDKAYENTD